MNEVSMAIVLTVVTQTKGKPESKASSMASIKPDVTIPYLASRKNVSTRLSAIRAQVEHPFAFMHRHGYNQARAKSKAANQAHFDMNCILYDVRRAVFLLKRDGYWA